MQSAQTFVRHPVMASQILSNAPKAAKRVVSVMLASYSMERSVLKRLSVAAMTMEKLTRYSVDLIL